MRTRHNPNNAAETIKIAYLDTSLVHRPPKVNALRIINGRVENVFWGYFGHWFDYGVSGFV